MFFITQPSLSRVVDTQYNFKYYLNYTWASYGILCIFDIAHGKNFEEKIHLSYHPELLLLPINTIETHVHKQKLTLYNNILCNIEILWEIN